MASIRIDQSHCNYHLAEHISRIGWRIVFTDAGRVSRGGTGERGISLDIFERNGFPIPDIVGVRAESLLMVEIDARLSIPMPSLHRYRANEAAILSEFGAAFEPNMKQLLLGFCRTGLRATQDVSVDAPLDLYFYFERPGVPRAVASGTA